MISPNPERRSERSRAAILKAALELCREQGFGKMTIDGIAKRAGVGKQTIYRWWPSKAAVLQEAMNDQIGAALEFHDTGDILADLRTQMTGVATAFASEDFIPYPRGLIAAAQNDPEIARSILTSLIKPRVKACKERLERAIKAGQLRPGLDLDNVIELLYAPLYYRLLLHTRPVTLQQVDHILELAFTGIAAGQPPRGHEPDDSDRGTSTTA